DMFARIKPTLKSMVPGQETPAEVDALKPWARAAVTLYVLTVVPLLLGFLALTAINLPRILATTWDSALVQYDRIGQAGAAAGAFHGFQMAVLLLPAAGILLTFWQLGRRVFGGLWTVTDGRPVARAGDVVVAGAAAAFAGASLLPQSEYRPIQPGE